MDTLHPPITVLVALGSLAVHIEEFLSPTGHLADKIAIDSILAQPEVRKWLAEMEKFAFLPVKREAPPAPTATPVKRKRK